MTDYEKDDQNAFEKRSKLNEDRFKGVKQLRDSILLKEAARAYSGVRDAYIENDGVVPEQTLDDYEANVSQQFLEAYLGGIDMNVTPKFASDALAQRAGAGNEQFEKVLRASGGNLEGILKGLENSGMDNAFNETFGPILTQGLEEYSGTEIGDAVKNRTGEIIFPTILESAEGKRQAIQAYVSGRVPGHLTKSSD